jgi:hypothetical protein
VLIGLRGAHEATRVHRAAWRRDELSFACTLPVFLNLRPHDANPFFYVIPFTLGIHEAW